MGAEFSNEAKYISFTQTPAMLSNESMIACTKMDFDVDLIATSGKSALFGELRKGGTELISTDNGPFQSHVMGVWHFLAATCKENLIETRQWHIPRYVMAREMASWGSAFEEFAAILRVRPLAGNIWGIPTRMGSPDKLTIDLPGDLSFEVAKEFTQRLRADIPLLEKAQAKIRERDGLFYIPRMMTAAGNPVESTSHELLVAIAFEKACRPRMDAGNFGIYSAYCTERDFETSIQMPDSIIHEMIEEQFARDPAEIPDDIHNLFLNTQLQLLSKPIWGRGIKVPVAAAAKILAKGIASLTRHQRVQLILMNGMHDASIVLSLATILGHCSLDNYCFYTCQQWAPDSPEEQVRRKESAYIKLYGELTGN